MHKSHFLLNLSMLLVLTHINFSVSYLIFTLSLKAFIIGGIKFLLRAFLLGKKVDSSVFNDLCPENYTSDTPEE